MALAAPPESFASKLLTCLNHKNPPTPLKEIARSLELEVRGINIPAFEGTVIRDPFRLGGIIAVCSTSGFARQRFTIAHEIGHYVLEHNKNSVCVFTDLQLLSKSNPIEEREANRFAAELLLPAKQVGPIITERGVSISTAKFVRDTFKASLTTSAFKCAELASQECAVVYVVNGIVNSYVPSKSWGLRILTGCSLNANTLAKKLLEDKSILERSGRVSAMAWTDPRDFMDFGVEVFEDSVHLWPYKTILSFLTVQR